MELAGRRADTHRTVVSIPALGPGIGQLQVRQVSLPFISFSASTDIGFRAVTNRRTERKIISKFFLNPFSNAE